MGLLWPAAAHAQSVSDEGEIAEPTPERDDLDDMDLEELMHIEIGSKKPQRVEEAPSIISVITRREIEALGLHDLADILRLVPGFEFGMDVGGLHGVGFRGIWGHEGKVLLMVDGTPINCFAYGNFNFFGSFSTDVIEKVEIIRGPGSAVYGTFAVAAVVNVITRRGRDFSGIEVRGGAGLVGDGADVARRVNVSVSVLTGDMELSAHAGLGFHPLSTRRYADFFDGGFDLGEEHSGRSFDHVIFKARVKQLRFSFNRNQIVYLGQDLYTRVAPTPNPAGIDAERFSYRVETLNLVYKQPLGDAVLLEPLVELSRGTSATTSVLADTMANGESGGTSMWNLRGELSASYQRGHASLVGGAGFIRRTTESVSNDGTPGLRDNLVFAADGSLLSSDLVDERHVDSFVGYGQYTHAFPGRLGTLGLTAGARYETTSLFGSAAAPRLGLTYVHGRTSAKLLYGRAFRIPLVWQAYGVTLTPVGELRPEIADTLEAEVGVRLASSVGARLNAFFIDIDEPITYIGSNRSYQNFGRLQSLGAEAEVTVRGERFGGFANLAYSRPGPDTHYIFTTEDGDGFLGMPPLKLNLAAHADWERVTLGATFTLLSPRFGQSPSSARDQEDAFQGDPLSIYAPGLLRTQRRDTVALLGVNAIARVTDELFVDLSAQNLLGAPYEVIQPYYGGHAPMPVGDRQVMLMLTWRMPR